jgi:hypothetical protein
LAVSLSIAGVSSARSRLAALDQLRQRSGGIVMQGAGRSASRIPHHRPHHLVIAPACSI